MEELICEGWGIEVCLIYFVWDIIMCLCMIKCNVRVYVIGDVWHFVYHSMCVVREKKDVYTVLECSTYMYT